MALGITVDITANLANFSVQIDKMATKLDQFQQRAETMSSRINSAFSALGVGLSAAGLVSFVKSGIDAADALNDMADRTGIAIEKLAGLEYAVKLGDTSMEAFAAASNKLAINMGKNSEEFAKLGITAQDPVEAFKQLADIFSSIEDPQQRAALGAAALGKSYAEMAPLLVKGGDGIQALIDKGQELTPISKAQAEAAGAFNDQLDTLARRMESLNVVVAGPIVEALNAFGDAMSFANEQADGFSPLQWLEAGSYGASGAAGQLEYLNQQIDTMTQSIADMKSQSAGGKLFDTLFGEGSLGEQTRKLAALTAARDKLLTPPAGKSAKADAPKVSNEAITGFITKTGDETEQSGKKFEAASKHVEKYRTEIDSLNKSLSDTAERLAKQRPDNLLQLNDITATPQEQADQRRKSLTQKNIEFDKANKSGNLADAARIAQEREQLAFENAKEDLYGVKAGELPSYKAFDAKQNYNKAAQDSQKAFDKFKASAQSTQAIAGDGTAVVPQTATDGKDPQAIAKNDLTTQLSQAEQLKKILDEFKNPIKIELSSNIDVTLKQADELQQKLNAISSGIAAANDATGGNAGNVNQALSTEVLKRGSRV